MVEFLWENFFTNSLCMFYIIFRWNYGQYRMELLIQSINISVSLQVLVTIQYVSSGEPASTLGCDEIYLPFKHVLHDTLYD